MYKEEGDSKAKRVRCLLKKSDRKTVLRVLESLWVYKQQIAPAAAQHDQAEYSVLRSRLEGIADNDSAGTSPVPAYQGVNFSTLTGELNAIKVLPAQQRGYRFESWLRDLFAAFRLEPRYAFRITVEQIDGSFKMEGEFYLLEAKWQQLLTAARDLRDFEAKIRQASETGRHFVPCHELPEFTGRKN